MSILIMAAQLMLSLSILVVLHEFGHFAPARWFGCRVEKFYLFFDPYFELFKKKIGETEWGIGWLPLGGYVKISGMIDESMDTEQMAGPEQPWEFRSKPAWQRLIIMIGGVTVNFILGFLIFAGILWGYGRTYIPTQNAVHGIYADSLGQAYGFQTGDMVLAIDTVELTKFGDNYLKNEILLRGRKNVLLKRNGAEMVLTLPDSLQRNMTSKAYKGLSLYSLPRPAVISSIPPDVPAARSQLKSGDKIVAVNGAPTLWLQDVLAEFKKTDATEIQLTVERAGSRLSFPVGLTETRRMDVPITELTATYQVVTEEFGVFEAIPEGIKDGWQAIVDQGNAVSQIFGGRLKARESVGSVFTMAEAFGATWDWYRFWKLTGILSLILAIMNLLPIPALDGGHVMFLLYEVITGRKPGDKFLQYATTAGAIFLMGFMALILLNDVLKLLS